MFSHFAKHLLIAEICLLCWGGFAHAEADIVGEVTLSIGQGRVISDSGATQDAARGMRIRAGDQIETGTGGHVHIRFVDGGLVSVRPSSKLQIEAYRNAQGQALAAIKFRLEEGVVRSVTGRWGEANRDRFRLNTPVAAIGVKGTDFVVKVDRGNTFASVVSGAIVMSPLQGECSQGLGPCQGALAATLSADMQGQMLEYLRTNAGGAPRLVPALDLMARSGGAISRTALAQGEAVADVASKTRTADSVASDSLNSGALAAVPRGQPLVWLHNAFDWNVPDNTISTRYSQALAAGRNPAVGNFFISLYRDENTKTSFLPVGGEASFRLASASANYVQPIAYGRPAEPVQISGAALNVDFNRATFNTQLALSSPSMGSQQLSASGSIGPTGVFSANQGAQSLAGAFSLDGLEAGYTFSKTLAGGQLSGLTLWGR